MESYEFSAAISTITEALGSTKEISGSDNVKSIQIDPYVTCWSDLSLDEQMLIRFPVDTTDIAGRSKSSCYLPQRADCTHPISCNNDSNGNSNFLRKENKSGTTKYIESELPGVYRKGIYICGTAVARGKSHQSQLVCMISIMMFNLGLAHQLLANQQDTQPGCSQSDESKKLKGDCLEKSKRLYELAHAAATDEDFETDALFSLAIINNMAFIYKDLNVDDTAEKAFQHLLSSVVCVIEGGDYCHSKYRYLLEHFLGNICHLVLQFSAGAAA